MSQGHIRAYRADSLHHGGPNAKGHDMSEHRWGGGGRGGLSFTVVEESPAKAATSRTVPAGHKAKGNGIYGGL